MVGDPVYPSYRNKEIVMTMDLASQAVTAVRFFGVQRRNKPLAILPVSASPQANHRP